MTSMDTAADLVDNIVRTQYLSIQNNWGIFKNQPELQVSFSHFFLIKSIIKIKIERRIFLIITDETKRSKIAVIFVIFSLKFRSFSRQKSENVQKRVRVKLQAETQGHHNDLTEFYDDLKLLIDEMNQLYKVNILVFFRKNSEPVVDARNDGKSDGKARGTSRDTSHCYLLYNPFLRIW